MKDRGVYPRLSEEYTEKVKEMSEIVGKIRTKCLNMYHKYADESPKCLILNSRGKVILHDSRSD